MSRDPIWSSSLPKKEIFSLRPEGQGGVDKEGQRVLQVRKAFRSKVWMLEKAYQRTEGILARQGEREKDGSGEAGRVSRGQIMEDLIGCAVQAVREGF